MAMWFKIKLNLEDGNVVQKFKSSSLENVQLGHFEGGPRVIFWRASIKHELNFTISNSFD